MIIKLVLLKAFDVEVNCPPFNFFSVWLLCYRKKCSALNLWCPAQAGVVGDVESCFCWFWSVSFAAQDLDCSKNSSEMCCSPPGCSGCLGFVCLLVLAKHLPQLSGSVTNVSHSLAGGSPVGGCPAVPGYLQKGHGDLWVHQAEESPRDCQDGPRDWSHRWNVLITICQCNQVETFPLLLCLFHSTGFSETKIAMPELQAVIQ